MSSKPRIAAWVLLFAVVGAVTLLVTRAVTPFVSLEAESGTKVGQAATVSDTTASAGSHLLFGSAPTPPPPGSCSGAPNLTTGSFTKLTSSLDSQVGGSYGVTDVQFSPANPCILYIHIADRGMWKSTNAGSTWTQVGAGTINGGNGLIRVNPANPDHLYTVQGVRGTGGFFVSTNGGATWTKPTGFSSTSPASLGGHDMYGIAVDPANFNHILVTYHYTWNAYPGNSGIMESTDGGLTWRVIPPGNWGSSHTIHFLDASNRWLLVTQDQGIFRTMDNGNTWTQVSQQDPPHGGSHLYRSPVNGALYTAGHEGIQRSTDNGATWTQFPLRIGFNTYSWHYGVQGDGTYLYTSAAYTGISTYGNLPFFRAPESDGTAASWAPYNTNQTFINGPFNAVYDSVNKIIYFANWNAGMIALKTQ